MVQRWIGALLLLGGIIYAVTVVHITAKERKVFQEERGSLPVLCLTEAAVYFLATLGISDFLLNTLSLKALRLADDKKLPGTLVGCNLLPGPVTAFLFLRVENPVSLSTLLCGCIFVALGSQVGVRLVGRLDGARIRRYMGIALIGSMLALVVRIIVSSGATGELTALSPAGLCVLAVTAFCWGLLTMLGVPMKPAGTAVMLILGMSPLAVLTMVVVMGCISPLSGGAEVLRTRRYLRKPVFCAVIGGTIGAILGAVFTISINALLLNIIILVLMGVAVVSMLRP